MPEHDPYGDKFAAADEERRAESRESDRNRGIERVAPEPEVVEEPEQPVTWPPYVKGSIRTLWREAGILPEENALVDGEYKSFNWSLEAEAPAHTTIGKERREEERGEVMERCVEALKFFDCKSTKDWQLRKELRGLSKEAGRQLGHLLKAIHLFEDGEAGFAHIRAARLRTNLVTRVGIPLLLEGLHPVYRTRGVQVGMLKELDLVFCRRPSFPVVRRRRRDTARRRRTRWGAWAWHGCATASSGSGTSGWSAWT